MGRLIDAKEESVVMMWIQHMREKFKLNLVTIVLFVLMVGLSFYDQYLLQKQMVTENRLNTVEKQKEQTNIYVETNLNEYLELGEEYVVLAIGAVGNLQDGGKAPIYKNADINAEVISELQYNCAVLICRDILKKNVSYNWIPVDLPNKNCIGYVNIEQIEIQSVKIEQATDNVYRNQIIRDAFSYIGVDFVRYGKSLQTGIDCSNYVQQIYEKAGIRIKNTPNEIKKQSQIIEEEEALPGDIVYYDANDGGGHVGMYLGNGLIINSAGHEGKIYPKGGVRICRLQYHDREIYEFCRIID